MRTLRTLLCGSAALGALALFVSTRTRTKPAGEPHETQHETHLIESLQRSLAEEKRLRMAAQKQVTELRREILVKRVAAKTTNGHMVP